MVISDVKAHSLCFWGNVWAGWRTPNRLSVVAGHIKQVLNHREGNQCAAHTPVTLCIDPSQNDFLVVEPQTHNTDTTVMLSGFTVAESTECTTKTGMHTVSYLGLVSL